MVNGLDSAQKKNYKCYSIAHSCLMKTRREILDYVQAQVVEQGGRAIDQEGNCSLETPSGKRCGFSLCLSEEGRAYVKAKRQGGIVSLLTEKEIEDSLAPEFRGHPKEFWFLVQKFHDMSIYWDSRNLLSEEGVDFYNNIDALVDSLL